VGESVDAVERVCDAIVRYLSIYPEAADSEEGITAWWLPAMDIEASAAVVADALHDLHRRGYIERLVQHDGRVLYRSASGGGNQCASAPA
jgi:hypothetical protein